VSVSANCSQSLTSLQNQNASKKGKKDKRKPKLTKEDTSSASASSPMTSAKATPALQPVANDTRSALMECFEFLSFILITF
jgi:hypothetical protein